MVEIVSSSIANCSNIREVQRLDSSVGEARMPGKRFVRHFNSDGSRGGLVHEDARIGAGVRIHRGAVVDIATVGSGTVIGEDCIVYGGAAIGSHVYIEESVTIGENARVGSNCRIGARAMVKPRVEVPNRTYIPEFAVVDAFSSILRRDGSAT